MAITTKSLQNKITRAANFEKVQEQYADAFIEQSAAEYLHVLCLKYQMKPGDIIRQAQIERTYGYQIFNGTRKPSRDKLLQLAFGFGLTLEETQDLLKQSGKSLLYSRIKRDAACIFGLTHHLNVLEMQELLASVSLPLFGEAT